MKKRRRKHAEKKLVKKFRTAKGERKGRKEKIEWETRKWKKKEICANLGIQKRGGPGGRSRPSEG